SSVNSPRVTQATGAVRVTCGSSVAACLRRTSLIEAFHARHPGLQVELVRLWPERPFPVEHEHFSSGSRADLAARLLMPPIYVRTSPDSRHEGDRLDDLRSVPGPDSCTAAVVVARRIVTLAGVWPTAKRNPSR